MNNAKNNSAIILAGVVACFMLSGFAALLYQMAWMRQFSLVFGTSELAIAAVLSAYMGGLSLGASLAARFVHRITRPVLYYGLLEVGIALSALAVPLLLKLAGIVYVGVLGGQPEPVDASGFGQSIFYLVIAFFVLAIPTTFMGATLPLLTKYVVQSKDQIGSRVGLLYATNTLGAIGGTLFAGFVLLPIMGLQETVWVGVAINLLVFVLAALIARKIGNHSQLVEKKSDNKGVQHESLNEEDSVPVSRLSILPLILISGANSFLYEVLWTRLLGHILGGSITAFATMLAGFLSGIAIGSAIAARFATTRTVAVYYFIGAQCGIALTSILIYQLLPLAIPESTGLGGNIIFAIMVLLPATIFIGATFPLAVRILAQGKADAAPASAKIYSWNTIGAIAGATLAVLFLIPLLKYEGSIKFAVLINACLAFAAAALLGRRDKKVIAGTLLFVFTLLIFYQPKMPEDILRSSPISAQSGGEIIFYEVGRSATVVVIEDNGLFYLRTNGLPEAAASVAGSPPGRSSQQFLSVLPVLARPDVDSMLVVGFGGGIALETVPASVKNIDVIELEPQVLKANELYADRRAINPLQDPRINVVINDARSALTLTDKKYDAIVSQPSHPWTAGASHLYTREFIALAKNHLSAEGVYLQWMNSRFIDEFLMKSLTATMLDVFPQVRMYQFKAGVILLIGSDQALNVEEDIARTGRPLSDAPLSYLENGIGSTEDLIVALSMDTDNLKTYAVDAPLITDNRNYMAIRSAQVTDSKTGLSPDKLYEHIKNYDPLVQADSWLRDDFMSSVVNFSYITRRLSAMGSHQRALDVTARLLEEGNSQALISLGLGLQSQGKRELSQQNLRRALTVNPESQQARYALLQPWFEDLFRGRAVPQYILDERAKLSGPAADVIRGLIALENNDMMGLVQLDAALAEAVPTDLWYTTSVKLRAEWRMQLTSPEYQPRMANEATALIDSAIAIFLDVQQYMMRIRSTYIAGDYISSLATARSTIHIIGDHVDRLEQSSQAGKARDISLRVRQLEELSRIMESIAEAVSSTVVAVEPIQASIDELKLRLLAI
jgi:spermidine synthase